MSLLDKTIEYSIKKGYIDATEGERTKKVVQSISAKHGFPEEWLVKMVLVEAEGFNPRKNNGLGCYGVVQVCGVSTVRENGGLAEVGGLQGFLNAGPAKQLEIWDRTHLSHWLKQAKRKPQSQGELMLINILPARYLDIAAGRKNGDTPMDTGQASFLYSDFNPATGRRTGGGYWSANSASKGMDWKAQSILGKGIVGELTDATINAAKGLVDLSVNSGQIISNALSTLNSGIQSALIRGDNCPPPPYTQQDRIVYPGCLQKTSNPTFGNGLGSGAAAPGITSIQPGQQNNQAAVGNSQPYTGELKPGGLVLPMKKGTYKFTSPFGPRWGRMHNGIDLAAPIGTPIYAAADGVVVDAKMRGVKGFGSWIRIQHPNNIRTTYGHVHTIYVKVGQQVRQGDRIADVGNEGLSTGPHLHWQTEPGGTPVNPLKYVKP